MKNVGMNKPYKGDKTGLKTEVRKLSIFLLAVLMSKEIFSQVPINGFCKYNTFPIDSGYNSLFAFNYNGDSYTDLLAYNTNNKKIEVLTSKAGGSFSKPQIINAPLEISKLQNVFDNHNRIKGYAFVSRKEMKTGIFTFSKYGRLSNSRVYKFKYYPENISVGDVKKNGENELLISGSAFDGISVLYPEKHKLVEKKVAEKSSFNNALFIDISNDGYPDIAAFNIINNTLNFYYNNSEGYFRQVRSIKMNNKISSLKSYDMNLDNYEDLLYVKDNSINIMYGDFASSYEAATTIKTLYHPDKFITGDFNKDGKIDIAYINFESSTLSILFAKSETEFYPEIIYLRKKGIRDIIPYYSKFINGIAAISCNGEIFTVANLTSITDYVDITAGGEPGVISYFDNGDNGIVDICYIDNFTSELKLLTRNNAGIPAYLYSIPLFHNQSQIIALDETPKIKTYYCYKLGGNLIEVIRVNFKTNKIQRNSLYSPGVIKDLKIKHEKNGKTKIYAAYIKNNYLGVSVFDQTDIRYVQTNYNNLDSSVYGISLAFNKEPMVCYWKKENGKIELYRRSVQKTDEVILPKKIIGFKDSLSISTLTDDLLNNEKDVSISFINSKEKKIVVVFSDKEVYTIKDKDMPKKMNVDSKNQLFFGELKFNGLKKLFVYTPADSSIKMIEFIHMGKNIVVSKISDAEGVKSFFIKNLNFKNYHLVYINGNKDCISIKQL